jgi:hypothetical protein
VQALSDSHEAGDLGLPGGRGLPATLWWPALDAAQRLAHQVLAACWSLDRSPGSTPALPASRAGSVVAELDELSRRAAPDGGAPDGEAGDGGTGDGGTGVGGADPDPARPPAPDREGFLGRELDAVRRALPGRGAG